MAVTANDIRSNVDTAQDAELASRVGQGDASAEADLCRRLLPRIRAWGFKRLRDDAAARDLAQHVMLTVLEALRGGKVERLDRLAAFVFGVCARTALAWGSEERHRSELLEKHLPDEAAVALVQEAVVDRRRLQHCFERLLPRSRNVLALSFFAGRSSEEVGKELRMTAGNVRVLRHRALSQLQQCMEGVQ